MNENSNAFAHPANILTLETFRLNGALIALGDAVAAPVGLTSARWQVMGAVAEARGALPVSGLARNMGLVRQSVQRIVDELTTLGLLRLAPNPPPPTRQAGAAHRPRRDPFRRGQHAMARLRRRALGQHRLGRGRARRRLLASPTGACRSTAADEVLRQHLCHEPPFRRAAPACRRCLAQGVVPWFRNCSANQSRKTRSRGDRCLARG